MMKLLLLISFTSLFLLTMTSASADDRQYRYKRSYGDAWYEIEKKYPSPEHRYSRKDLDQARRRANNSLWMKYHGNKDPIYQSDQYRGQSSRSYRRPYYRSNRYGNRW